MVLEAYLSKISWTLIFAYSLPKHFYVFLLLVYIRNQEEPE